MKVAYTVNIVKPEHHYISVSLKIQNAPNEFEVFIPSWSPGSYLMREYAKHLRRIKGIDAKGKTVFIEKIKKGTWRVDGGALGSDCSEVTISYEMYCHELTVRNSHVNADHAFLHGPSVLMGVKGALDQSLELELKFPNEWQKVTTGLKSISKNREQFLYSAQSFDELIDCPIEIGNQLTDGFMHKGLEHHLSFYGKTLSHPYDLKEDIKKIVETVSEYMGDIPYDNYTFMTHFAPDYYGGLEHLNSTALGFDGRKIADRNSYVKWLTLVTHEYFHTWNVKRIRPFELGPFDYENEAYTSMLWLAEGLTSFMDNYLTWKSGLITENEYWGLIKDDLNRYFATQGRKFDSLEASSLDAWIKLYRPHENSANSTVSYYLKGGIVFLCLHALMKKAGFDSKQLVLDLWESFKTDCSKGLKREDFFRILEACSNKNIADKFSGFVSDTCDVGVEEILKSVGIEFDWEKLKPTLGCNFEYRGERVIIKTIRQDSSSFKSGLNAGDEIIAIDGLKFDKKIAKNYQSFLLENQSYAFTILRMGEVRNLNVSLGPGLKVIKKIKPNNNDW